MMCIGAVQRSVVQCSVVHGIVEHYSYVQQRKEVQCSKVYQMAGLFTLVWDATVLGQECSCWPQTIYTPTALAQSSTVLKATVVHYSKHNCILIH